MKHTEGALTSAPGHWPVHRGHMRPGSRDFYVRGHDGDGDRIQAHTGTAKSKGGGRTGGKGKRRGREARQQQARGRGGARRVTFKRARRG